MGAAGSALFGAAQVEHPSPHNRCSHYGNDAAVAHLALAERELRERREREIAEAEEQVGCGLEVCRQRCVCACVCACVCGFEADWAKWDLERLRCWVVRKAKVPKAS